VLGVPVADDVDPVLPADGLAALTQALDAGPGLHAARLLGQDGHAVVCVVGAWLVGNRSWRLRT